MAVFIFSDASFAPGRDWGVGAVLRIPEELLNAVDAGTSNLIKTKVFRETNIARLEISTVLWALEMFQNSKSTESIHLFTDCQAITNLAERRAKLEANDYKSKRTQSLLSNADLYQQFFKVCDTLRPTLEWIQGHSPKAKQTAHQKTFALVDKAARRALRELLP